MRRKRRVYPRVCGGTGDGHESQQEAHGLSPRVRGNLPKHMDVGPIRRSIPACAGEPTFRVKEGDQRKVYPRVCGGTVVASLTLARMSGLSPRVRGNPQGLSGPITSYRSIPACAGEPASLAQAAATSTVYPRVCGGTPREGPRDLLSHGLSPRVRGNRNAFSRLRSGHRSIPACAGEPHRLFPRSVDQQVYPRVCGGTSKRSFLVASFAKWLYLSCTSLSRCRRRRLSLWAPLPEAVFAGRQPLMARARSSLSTLAAIRHTTEQGLPRPFSLCRASCSERCIRRALSPTWPRQESLDNALQH